MKVIRAALVLGLAFWMIGTAVLVPFGHRIFGPDNLVPIAFSSAGIVAVTFAAVYRAGGRILRRSPVANIGEGALLGAFACMPGLVLDGVLYAINGGRYPGLNAAASGAMSATLLLTYAAGLAAALTAARERSG